MVKKLNLAFDRLAKSYGRLVILFALPDSPNRIPVLRLESWIFLKRAWSVFWRAMVLWLRVRLPSG